jgi:hypothetical protein
VITADDRLCVVPGIERRPTIGTKLARIRHTIVAIVGIPVGGWGFGMGPATVAYMDSRRIQRPAGG